jgi:pseudouridine-5'-phosphate glycosidase
VLHVAKEVQDALAEHRPVVALESTLIAHGLPWPVGWELAQALEAEVRLAGAVPATIAVVQGVPKVGLCAETLERLSRHGKDFVKVGAADLPVVLARRADAATTVSATATLAARAGIALFATGGIGGVHRGPSGDASLDLAVLAREPVCVVSAGAKAILDLPRTAEALESLGVLVLGYGTAEMPAFYTRTSGIPLPHRVDTPDEVATILSVRFGELGQGGVVVMNPIPAEAALDPHAIDEAIARALALAEKTGIQGKALTPFLLAELARTTHGAAVTANQALALSNARVAAAIAVAYARRAR